jgi:hypothetical protein
MDLGSILTGVIAIGLCILPFILFAMNKNKSKAILLDSLSKVADEQKYKISKHELGSEFALGLDENSNHLFFYKKIKDKETKSIVNLNNISDVSVIKTNKTLGSNGSSQQVIDSLALQFSSSDLKNPKTQIEFYNMKDSMQISGELDIMNRWHEMLMSRIKK